MPDLHDCTNDELVAEVERRRGGNSKGIFVNAQRSTH